MNLLSNIPQQRLLLYIVVLGLLPVLGAFFYFTSQLKHLNNVSNQILYVEQLAATKANKQGVNQSLRSHYKDADHFYIDKSLENICFLQSESESLKKVMQNKNFPEDENIKRRLGMICGSENALVFTEGVVQSTPIFQETTETLAHPVEIDISDIRKLLARIEGTQIGTENPTPNRPQLIILDFKIEKKQVSERNDVFILNLKLLKREFL